MLHVALLCVLVGQAPPPPVPHPPEGQAAPAAKAPSNSQANREWLLAHLIVDMQAQGKFDAQKYHDMEALLNNMSASQLGVLVEYYQQRKAQVEALQQAQAEANLRRLEAYRDCLERELQWKIASREQARGMMDSMLAAQQPPWAMPNFYAVQAWPYYVPGPYYYAPRAYHRHYHR
jgi:hypothetical protein